MVGLHYIYFAIQYMKSLKTSRIITLPSLRCSNWIAFVLIAGIFIMEQEIFKPVYGYEGLYEVSNFGKVKSFHRYKKGVLLKPGLSSNGYLTVFLAKDKKHTSVCIQILVLEAFKEPRPEGMLALHGDSNKLNNHVGNLRWGTYSDNAKDQIINNTFNFDKGEKHQLSKLTTTQVIEIKRLLSSTSLTQRQVAIQFGVRPQQISKIKNGTRWAHITI